VNGLDARLTGFEELEENTLRREFERAYRTPGVKHLGAATALGTCAILSYYFLDVFYAGLPWIGGAQTVRLALPTLCASVALMCWANIELAARY
jgi:hypothetical protein